MQPNEYVKFCPIRSAILTLGRCKEVYWESRHPLSSTASRSPEKFSPLGLRLKLEKGPWASPSSTPRICNLALKDCNPLRAMAWPPEFYCSQHRHVENSQSVLCAKTIQKVMNDARFWVMLSHDFCVASSFLVFNFCCHGNCPEEHRLSVISCRQSDNISKKSGTVSITVNQYLLDSSGPSWATLGVCTEICP